jgi:hypothetical protein
MAGQDKDRAEGTALRRLWQVRLITPQIAVLLEEKERFF